jgi:hypothetical protein
MLTRPSVSLVVPLVTVLIALPLKAQNPDCGKTCASCGLQGWEGRSYDPQGRFNMDCVNFISYCVACPDPELVSEYPAQSAELVTLIRNGNGPTLATTLRSHGDRLLLSVSRSAVVIRGNRCDPFALTAVVFVPRARAVELARLGLQSLEDYLNGAVREK